MAISHLTHLTIIMTLPHIRTKLDQLYDVIPIFVRYESRFSSEDGVLRYLTTTRWHCFQIKLFNDDHSREKYRLLKVGKSHRVDEKIDFRSVTNCMSRHFGYLVRGLLQKELRLKHNFQQMKCYLIFNHSTLDVSLRSNKIFHARDQEQIKLVKRTFFLNTSPHETYIN